MPHRNQILGRGGESLADVYDVAGSQVEIEELDSREIKTVHEMGGVLFAERYGGSTTEIQTAALAASATFDLEFPNIPENPTRILAVSVTSDVTARVNNLVVSIVQPTDQTDVPIWTWQLGSGQDREKSLRLDLNSAGAGQRIYYQPGEITGIPNMLTGSFSPAEVSRVFFRGLTSGFGAGTITLEATLLLAFAQPGGVSSRGLPIPSW